jgi:hypothetical protein
LICVAARDRSGASLRSLESLVHQGGGMTKKTANTKKSANTSTGPRADKETLEERQVAIAQLRGMSREDRLALLMRNFSVDCAELGGRPRRGAPAPRKSPSGCGRD